jgi:hypothetical protein
VLILTGVLGLVQALFLPGFVAARALGVRGGLRVLTTSMALSLLLNLALVSLLVDLGAYRREVMFAIFALECAWAWWVMARRARRGAAGSGGSMDSGSSAASGGSMDSRGSAASGDSTASSALPTSAASDDSNSSSRRFSAMELLAAVAVIALAVWYVGRVARAASGIFSGWDDVASWNRWAMDWYRGGFPEHTWNYPQVVPVAWSLTYAFMGTDFVQSFARGMMPLFGLAAMLAFADRARGEARLGMLAAAWFAGMFLARVNNVTAGLADLPVAFFASLALAECLRPPEAERAPAAGRGASLRGASPRGASRPWAALFAAGAALAKQAGVFLVLVVPALAALREPRGRRLGAALRGYLLAAAIVAPWYILKQREIAAGRESSEIGHVLGGAHGGLAPLERAVAGFARLAEIAGGLPVLLVVLALGLLGLRKRAVRPLLLGVAIPFTILWAFGFSYDPRNLSVALVAWALGCGAGVAGLVERVKWLNVPMPVSVPTLAARPLRIGSAVLVVAALAAAVALVPDAKVLAHQRRLQRGLGDPVVAGALADLREGGGLDGRIVADESTLLAYAPGWDSLLVPIAIRDPERLEAAAAEDGVRWLLLPKDVPVPAPAAAAGLTPARVWSRVRDLGAVELWRSELADSGGSLESR